jgi:glycosyltransferase involved in cell wall biosynthesis
LTLSVKVVLVSSGQPSLNPRLVKEADALTAAGYEVTVLYAYWNNWGTTFDNDLLPTKKWTSVRVGGHPTEARFTYLLSRCIHKAAKAGMKLFGPAMFAEAAITRSGYFLSRTAKKYRADIYIGHNLGALSAVVVAAKSNSKPCGFDAEDFHRNEVSDHKTDSDVILKTFLEDKYIPKINYLTTSSPLISEEYKRLYTQKPEIILNVFPKGGYIEPVADTGVIKIFWFSQTIGHSRGIEEIVEAVKLSGQHLFALHLLGQCTAGFKKKLLAMGVAIQFHSPIPPGELISFARQFDIGIAAESKVPFNRDICLTNKIFTYMQAGLAIAASDTNAQSALLNANPLIGKIYQQNDIKSLAELLLFYHQSRVRLMESKKAALNLAESKFNWNIESRKFLAVVQKALNTFE